MQLLFRSYWEDQKLGYPLKAAQAGVGRNKTTQAKRVVAFPALLEAACEMPETQILAVARTRLFRLIFVPP